MTARPWAYVLRYSYSVYVLSSPFWFHNCCVNQLVAFCQRSKKYQSFSSLLLNSILVRLKLL